MSACMSACMSAWDSAIFSDFDVTANRNRCTGVCGAVTGATRVVLSPLTETSLWSDPHSPRGGPRLYRP